MLVEDTVSLVTTVVFSSWVLFLILCALKVLLAVRSRSKL